MRTVRLLLQSEPQLESEPGSHLLGDREFHVVALEINEDILGRDAHYLR